MYYGFELDFNGTYMQYYALRNCAVYENSWEVTVSSLDVLQSIFTFLTLCAWW